MRFHEFFPEAANKPYSYSKVEDGKDLAKITKLVETHCYQALQSGPLWRGMSYKGPVLKMDPSTGNRVSANTFNHYTLLIDNSSHFKGWPARSKSLICSTSFSTAQNFSNDTYAIFPFNGVKIGVMPYYDMWVTEIDMGPFLHRKLSIDHVATILHLLGVPDSSYQDMVKYCQSEKFAEDFMEEYPFCEADPKQLISYLEDKLTPKKMNLDLVTPDKLGKYMKQDRECWFSGPCIAIEESIYLKWKRTVAY